MVVGLDGSRPGNETFGGMFSISRALLVGCFAVLVAVKVLLIALIAFVGFEGNGFRGRPSFFFLGSGSVGGGANTNELCFNLCGPFNESGLCWRGLFVGVIIP